MNNVLSSKWGGLNPALLASFWAVDRDGKRIDDITVKAPLIESNLEVSLDWRSQFESAGTETTPTLQAMLQSGTLHPVLEKIDAQTGSNLSVLAASVEGRTSITKLNSTQVLMGAQPAKFNVTALFRAWSDPQTEVLDPFNQLMAWALPVKLEPDGSIFSRLADKGIDSSVAFPSRAPVMIAVKYKDATYLPLVIESIAKDTNAPIDKNGRFIELTVPIQLSTIAAIDRQDWHNFTRNG